jgi:hypothetical protein
LYEADSFVRATNPSKLMSQRERERERVRERGGRETKQRDKRSTWDPRHNKAYVEHK